MPPKKRDKEKDAETSKAIRQESSNDDHEQFLQAFESKLTICLYYLHNLVVDIFSITVCQKFLILTVF